MSTSSDYSLTHLTCQHVLSGIGRYGLELCRALRTSHPELEFYKPFKPGHPDSFLHEEEAWIKKVPYRSFRGLHPYVMPWYLYKAVPRRADRVYHAHWFQSGLAALALVRLRSPTKAVVTMHDVSLLHIPEGPRSYRAYYVWALKRFKAAGVPIICVSESARADALKYGGFPEHQVFAIPNGIDHGQFFPAVTAPRDRFRVIYSGGLGPRKNVELLLRAFAVFEQKVPDSELLVAGSHPDRTGLPALAQSLGIQNIRFTGFIPDALMADFYRDADVMVFPSLYEGFGFAPLEAMACGTPVLSGTGGSLREISGPGALLFEYSMEDLVEKMLFLAGSGSERDALREAGLKQAAGFTWERTAEMTKDVYRQSL